MEYESINLRNKLNLFSNHWSPKIIASLNDYHLKVVKFKGKFVWHSHDDTDEMFLVIKGAMEIHFRDGSVKLSAGELYVVPKGIEHKPSAEKECEVLLIEPAGVVNTGNTGGELTAPNDEWV